jgi:hypothetical protein
VTVPRETIVEITSRWRFSGAKDMASAVSLLILLSTVAPVSAQETENQFWPEIDTFVKLSGETRLFFIYSATRPSDVSTYSDGQVGGYLDFYTFPVLGARVRRHADDARSKSLMIRAGYLLDRTPSGSENTPVTHMPTVEAHGRVTLPGHLLLSDRNRFDFRIVNGDYRPRYRNRLKVERTFKTGRFELTPYAHVEVFYDWHNNTFNRFRYSGGAEWTLTRHITIESYYSRQRDTGPPERFTNAVGLAAQFYLR